MTIILYFIIIGGLVVSECQQETPKAAKKAKSKAQVFYSSSAWRKARQECFKLQMQRSGLRHIECEVCGSTSRDFDDSGKRVVMSVGHDKARSTHSHLALEQDNLFPQCMPCNIGQGTETRLIMEA
jgi:hypothetical protein